MMSDLEMDSGVDVVVLLQLIDRRDSSLQAYPLERRLLTSVGMALFDQSNRLEHIGYVVQPSDFSLQFLLILLLFVCYLKLTYPVGCFLQAQD
jgi:hypothetical protein